MEDQNGSLLVFLPGQAEIRDVHEQLLEHLGGRNDVLLCPLYGELDLTCQRAAIEPAPPDKRKIVLATSIAETSLTIEGVRVVIDAGLARVPRFDPVSGMTRLHTQRVSRAAATQRTGRAGRLESGICYRLWSEAQHDQFVAYDNPEILQADLSELALQLCRWGVKPEDLAWLDAPPSAAFAQAGDLLQSLGALDGRGVITSHGHTMAQLPTHPRLSQEALFFSMPASGELASADPEFPDLKLSGALSSFFASISGIFLDPKVPRLSPRKMRKYKSLGMHTAGVSTSTVATALNHSVAVNLSTYSEATPEQQEVEFGQFWRAVHHAAQVVRERSQRPAEHEIATGAGHCNGFNQPIPSRASGSASIEPNCRNQYGCLHCEHYICHSDEEDLHKLVSLQYVINAVRKTAHDTAHAEALYKELSIRIEFILEALGERSDAVKQLVETIKAKVFEYGELTPFWEKRLSRYEKMGVVF